VSAHSTPGPARPAKGCDLNPLRVYVFSTDQRHFFAPFLYAFGYIGLRICPKEATVTDILYLVLLIGFFAVSAALVYGCERLTGRRS
jgi:hypothetical protein